MGRREAPPASAAIVRPRPAVAGEVITDWATAERNAKRWNDQWRASWNKVARAHTADAMWSVRTTGHRQGNDTHALLAMLDATRDHPDQAYELTVGTDPAQSRTKRAKTGNCHAAAGVGIARTHDEWIQLTLRETVRVHEPEPNRGDNERTLAGLAIATTIANCANDGHAHGDRAAWDASREGHRQLWITHHRFAWAPGDAASDAALSGWNNSAVLPATEPYLAWATAASDADIGIAASDLLLESGSGWIGVPGYQIGGLTITARGGTLAQSRLDSSLPRSAAHMRIRSTVVANERTSKTRLTECHNMLTGLLPSKRTYDQELMGELCGRLAARVRMSLLNAEIDEATIRQDWHRYQSEQREA